MPASPARSVNRFTECERSLVNINAKIVVKLRSEVAEINNCANEDLLHWISRLLAGSTS